MFYCDSISIGSDPLRRPIPARGIESWRRRIRCSSFCTRPEVSLLVESLCCCWSALGTAHRSSPGRYTNSSPHRSTISHRCKDACNAIPATPALSRLHGLASPAGVRKYADLGGRSFRRSPPESFIVVGSTQAVLLTAEQGRLFLFPFVQVEPIQQELLAQPFVSLLELRES